MFFSFLFFGCDYKRHNLEIIYSIHQVLRVLAKAFTIRLASYKKCAGESNKATDFFVKMPQCQARVATRPRAHVIGAQTAGPVSSGSTL